METGSGSVPAGKAVTMCGRTAGALCASLLTLLAAAEARAASKATLRTTGLPTPEAVVSQSDVVSQNFTPIYIDKGNVWSGNRITFARAGEKTFSIGGTEVTIGHDGRQFSFGSGRAGPVKLAKKGQGYAPQLVMLPDRRRYVVAFAGASLRSISYRSGSIQVGYVGGASFALYDDNTDGRYTTGDTFMAGSPHVFAPLAEHVSVGRSVCRIETVPTDGSSVSYSRYEGETCRVKVKRAPTLHDAHVAFGSGEAKLNFTTDCGSKPVNVIPGTYELLYGLAYSRQLRKPVAGIIPGDFEPVQASGREARIVLGGPYELEFAVTVTGRKIQISPSSFKLKGAAGERYVSFRHKQVPTIYLNGRVNGRMAYG